MTIAAVTDADYTSTVEAFRRCLAAGTPLTQLEMQLGLAVTKDAVARYGTGNTAQEAVRATLATQITATATQATATGTTIRGAIVVLDAAACAANAGADAAAVIVTQSAALSTAATAITAIGTALTSARAAILTGEIAVPTYVTNSNADG